MRATIDAAGRVVVPKPLREALGLQPGQALEVQVRDGRLEIEIALVEMRLEKGRHGLVAVPTEPVPTLTAELVRDSLERSRR
jgi:AbrB family looped-hinge helix DNA binding protein